MRIIPDNILSSKIHTIPDNKNSPAEIKRNIPIPTEICVEKNNIMIIIRTLNQPIKALLL